MVWQTLEAGLLTELVQQFELVLQPLLLFSAYVAMDISRKGYLSVRNIVKKEIASAVFYFTLVFFMRFILMQTLAPLITQNIVIGMIWFACLVGLILLTAVVFRDAIKNEVQFKTLSSRTSNLEMRFEGLLNKLNQESQKADMLKTQFVSAIQSVNNNITLLMAQTKTVENDFKGVVEDYKALVGQYQADTALSKKGVVQYESLLEELQNLLQSLLARVEELTRLQREYKEKIDGTSPANDGNSTKPAPVEREPIKLTKEDGLTNRKKGNNAQVETYEFLKGLGFVLENDCSRSAPDFLFYNSSLMVGVGAHKAFTLTKQGTRQRSISAESLDVEYETAKELRLPLILFVLNLDNGQRWAHFIPHGELDKFKLKSVCTPLILAENSQEAYETLRNSVLEVKRQLGY